MRIKNISYKKMAFLLLISLTVIFVISFFIRKDEIKKEILLLENSPQTIIDDLSEGFPDYMVKTSGDMHLYDFLNGSEKTLIYEVEAEKLLSSAKKFFYYPIYRDHISLIIDRDQLTEDIGGWEDLHKIDKEVGLAGNSVETKYIWASLTRAYGEAINKNSGTRYFKKLNDRDLLIGKNEGAAIEIGFSLEAIDKLKEGKNIEIILPKEGTLEFNIGLLSHKPMEEEELSSIRSDFKKEMEFLSTFVKGNIRKVEDAGNYYEEINKIDFLTKTYRRNIMGIKKHAPVDNQEHHVVSIFLVLFILVSMEFIKNSVIHVGIRRGLVLTIHLLVGWIFFGIFKYAIHGYTLINHYSWYFYYVFYLPMPILALYIAENVDSLESKKLSKLTKINGLIGLGLLILVLTNDLHQLIFTFSSNDLEIMQKDYGYGLGFIILTAWYTLTSIYAFLLMLKKGFDAPKKRNMVLPILVILLALTYSISYNLRIPISADFPFVLSLAILITLFWVSSTFSGLIPNNRGYFHLFQNSSLNMEVYNRHNQLIYKTLGHKADNVLIKNYPIKGGRVYSYEDIGHIKKLREELNKSIVALEKENKILIQKEKLDSKIYMVNEQNKLANEVNETIKDKLEEIDFLIDEIQRGVSNSNKLINRVQLIIIYIKRRSELLVKSKGQDEFPTRELCRIFRELANIPQRNWSVFCMIDKQIDFGFASKVYNYFYEIINIMEENELMDTTIQISKQGNDFKIYLICDHKNKDFERDLVDKLDKTKEISYSSKELGDAYSLTIVIRGGELNA